MPARKPTTSCECDFPTDFITVTEDFDDDGISVRQNYIPVYSLVLIEGSPVFAKMFSDKYLEGKAVSTYAPPEQIFPDDDPEMLDFVINIVHGRDELDYKMDFSLLGPFVQLVDKYDLSRAHCLRYWYRDWASLVVEDCLNWKRKHCIEMMSMAYLFDDHERFFKCTQWILQFFAEEETDEYPDFVETLRLPKTLGTLQPPAHSFRIHQLTVIFLFLLDYLKSSITETIAQLKKEVAALLFPRHHDAPDCKVIRQISKGFSHNLVKRNHGNIPPICAKLQQWVDFIKVNHPELKCTYGTKQKCLNTLSKIQRLAIADIRNGLCLECVKNGRLGRQLSSGGLTPADGEGGNCRTVQH
ncbi:MAG: hypothetical protein LQ342_002008 [Letrouitia transgressa]|nr:MAG: hypothetical protein LQ342_002008 [Letrouitia transgressa]